MSAFVSGPALRWGAWHGDEIVRVPVGAAWEVDVATFPETRALTDADVDRTVDDGVDAHLAGIDAGTRVAIAIDDMARPTPLDRIVPRLVARLRARGVRPERIAIIVATGSHRPLTRLDLEKKLGPPILDEIAVHNHHPYENLVDLGESERGTPVRINADFLAADRRIVCGSVMPHPYMGFGGGAKMVLPGLSGIESLEANHRSVLRGLTGGLLTLEGNEARADVEQIAGSIGVDLALQAVVGTRRELVGLFAGDVVAAHRQAAETALDVYRVKDDPEGDYDVVFLGAYPKDGEQYQLGNAFNALRTARGELLRAGGSLVLVARCPEGTGHHGLQGRGMRLHRTPVRREMMRDGREIVVFSPGLSAPTLTASFHEGARLARTRAALEAILAERHGESARALVVPCAPLAILAGPPR